jgi:hypothetical protein
MSIAIGITFVVLVVASLALRRRTLRRRSDLAAKHGLRVFPTRQMKPHPVEPLTQAAPPVHSTDLAPVTRYNAASKPAENTTNQAAALFVLGTMLAHSGPDEEERRRDEEQRRRDDARDDNIRRDNDRYEEDRRERDEQRYEERSADVSNDTSVNDNSSDLWN